MLQGMARLEKRYKSILEQLRGELGLDPGYVPRAHPSERGHGQPGNTASGYFHAISAPLWESLQKHRQPLTSATRALIQRDLPLAARRKLPHRLWLSFYKELDAVQQTLKLLATPAGAAALTRDGPRRAPQANADALRALLFCMIGQAEREIGGLVSAIERSEGSGSGSGGGGGGRANGAAAAAAAAEDAAVARRHVLQALLTAMGDLARYKQLHRPAGEPRDWGAAEALYHCAFRLRPGAGKPWNQLALVATLKKDSFAAFYHYLRSLCAADEPCPAREPLLALHERCKRQLAALSGARGGGGGGGGVLPLSEHTHRFLLRLLVACGACLARVDLSAFDAHLAAARVHLLMSLQLQLGADRATAAAVAQQKKQQQRGGRGAAAAAEVRRSEGAAAAAAAAVAAGMAAARRRLPAHLTRVALLAVCTTAACGASWAERGGAGARERWADDTATRNSVRLVLALMGAMAGAAAAAGYGPAAAEWQHATLPAVCICLDWLRCESRYGDGIKRQQQRVSRSPRSNTHGMLVLGVPRHGRHRAECPDAFRSAMAAVAQLHAATAASSAAPPDTPLLEDVECQGLAALAPAVARRLARRADAAADAAAAAASVDPRRVRMARLRQFAAWAAERGWLERVSGGAPAGSAVGGGVMYRAPGGGGSGGGGGGGGGDEEASGGGSSGDGSGGGAAMNGDSGSEGGGGGGGSDGGGGAENGDGRALIDDDFEDEGIQYASSDAAASEPEADYALPPASAAASKPAAAPAALAAPSAPPASPVPQQAPPLLPAAVAAAPMQQRAAPAATPPPAAAAAASFGQLGSHAGATAPAALDAQRMSSPPLLPPAPAQPQQQQQQHDDSPEALAVAAALADLGISEGGGGGGGGYTDERAVGPPSRAEEEFLPAGLLGMVMAGLGDPDERLCAVCCNTLAPGAPLYSPCPFCGAPAGASEPMADVSGGAAHGGGGPEAFSFQSVLNTSLGGGGGGSSSSLLLESPAPRVADAAGSSAAARAPAVGSGGGGGGGAIGGGILSNVNMAEVLGSSARQAAAAPPSYASPQGSRSPQLAAARQQQQQRGAAKPAPRAMPELVVIDVPNVAMEHGRGRRFSTRGVRIAAEHFRAAGHRVVGFVPRHHLDARRGAGAAGAAGDEDTALLQAMVDEGLVVPTPAGDYDDSYCIAYCMQHNGCVVTNDQYRDHYAALQGAKKREAARRWVKGHTISYTFVGDEFMPNPDFQFSGLYDCEGL
ncbi:Zc3h12a-like ribonuclease NYN domain-containing protein [Tribonema minus]|uniref:Zc3h12a-like ribonuclease NYN domain-containing protein n=1 Tax=Tribonema minus TaxID=303371 RepID=A0A835YPQ7_9STRA|nr:Zc3h12a-like ribonuclease NYN domain-containing protein [Tribonema minus]